jgi:hypothetical protein
MGDKLKWKTLSSFPKRSKASPRFTEATLVRELEKNGIGRPSTFASLVDTLFDKNYIEKKYINLIENYISKTDETIILSSSLSNKVVDFLIENQYSFKFNQKFFEDREKNAIVDLLTAKYCNHIFIGNFNIKNLNGRRDYMNDDGILMFILAFIVTPFLIWLVSTIYG